MLDRRMLLVPVFLAAQALVVHWAETGEIRPAPPEAAKLPIEFGGWTRSSVNPTDLPERVLHADRLVDWDYYRAGADPAVANLFIAWFQSLRSGAVQPHSPQLCLPGNGWTIESTSEAAVETPAGVVPITRVLIAKGPQRGAILYWYQMARRPVASEWQSKVWLAADLFHEKRTDLALVRVAVMSQRDDSERMRAASEFTRAAYPAVRDWLPH
jgi:EpsI family protein